MNISSLANLIGVKPDERVDIFVDGQSFYNASRSEGFDVDYAKLSKLYEDHVDVHRKHYHVAISKDSDVEYNPLVKLTDYMEFNGWDVTIKDAPIQTDTNGRRRIRGSMAVEIALGMVRAAPQNDRIVLFSNDIDLYAAIEEVKRSGTLVTVVLSNETKTGRDVNDLRRLADNSVMLSNIKHLITRHTSDHA